MPRPTLIRAIAFAFALPVLAVAQVTFNFNYTDSGTGFDDATLGASRRSALESVANTLSSYFSSYSARTVTFDVYSYSGNFDGRLASAGAGYASTPDHAFRGGDVFEKIVNGVDNGPGAEGVIIWNFTYSWSYGSTVSGGTFDFQAVALHEITHTLGFASLMDVNGAGAGTGTTYSLFDQYLTDVSGNRLVTAGGTYAGGTILTNGAGSDVYFSGPEAMAVFGGRVPIYSPATFVEGSSLSHLDTDYFTSEAYVMEHAVAPGLATRTLSTLELAMLSDIGYTITAVPEPASVALIAGVLALVGVLRRRRTA